MASKDWKATMDDFRLWLQLHGFEAEVPFKGLSGKRRWRWDWAKEGWETDAGEPLPRVAVEYQGMGVGHQSIGGTFRDHAKTTEGQLMGWTVILCNAKTVESGECQDWVERAMDFAP